MQIVIAQKSYARANRCTRDKVAPFLDHQLSSVDPGDALCLQGSIGPDALDS